LTVGEMLQIGSCKVEHYTACSFRMYTHLHNTLPCHKHHITTNN